MPETRSASTARNNLDRDAHVVLESSDAQEHTDTIIAQQLGGPSNWVWGLLRTSERTT